MCCSTLHPLPTQPSTHAMHDFQLAVAWNTSRLAETMPPPSRESCTILAYSSLCARPSSSHHCQTKLQPSPKPRETAYPTFHCSYTTAPFRSIARRVVHLSGSSAETECPDDPADPPSADPASAARRSWRWEGRHRAGAEEIDQGRAPPHLPWLRRHRVGDSLQEVESQAVGRPQRPDFRSSLERGRVGALEQPVDGDGVGQLRGR